MTGADGSQHNGRHASNRGVPVPWPFLNASPGASPWLDLIPAVGSSDRCSAIGPRVCRQGRSVRRYRGRYNAGHLSARLQELTRVEGRLQVAKSAGGFRGQGFRGPALEVSRRSHVVAAIQLSKQMTSISYLISSLISQTAADRASLRAPSPAACRPGSCRRSQAAARPPAPPARVSCTARQIPRSLHPSRPLPCARKPHPLVRAGFSPDRYRLLPSGSASPMRSPSGPRM